jgi:hypothetical protein
MTIKLSDTQHAALVEVSELGYTVAKANTIKSLETKELIDAVGATHHKLTSKGRAVLGLSSEVEESDREWADADADRFFGQPVLVEGQTFHETLMEDVGELESALQGDPWKMDEPLADWELEALSGAVQAETFDNSLPDSIKVNRGFAATLEWRNTKVWHGLTAEEIREDMDTRVPANRADKRAHNKAHRKVIKQLVGAL